MSGPPDHRHQIEFSDDLALFFRDEERADEIVSMRGNLGGPDWSRPLTYRGTDYGQWTEMWRLGLLTRRMGGPDYAGRVIRLERVTRAGNVSYRLLVAEAGSQEAGEWRTNSAGNAAITGGPHGREYGFW